MNLYPSAPGPPDSLVFESPTDSSLILLWTPPLEANGILLGYIVQYQQGTTLPQPQARNLLPRPCHTDDPSLITAQDQ